LYCTFRFSTKELTVAGTAPGFNGIPSYFSLMRENQLRCKTINIFVHLQIIFVISIQRRDVMSFAGDFPALKQKFVWSTGSGVEKPLAVKTKATVNEHRIVRK